MKDDKEKRHLVYLLETKEIAAEKLQQRAEEGKIIRTKIESASNPDKLLEALDDHTKWSDYNSLLLSITFSDDSLKSEYDSIWGAGMTITTGRSDPYTMTIPIINNQISTLESIANRLDLIPERKDKEEPIKEGIIEDNKIFIVHGHDEGLKQTVARFLEKLEIEVIILHEQPNSGRTIIEKFEVFSDVGFAVILMTPDDVGAPASKRNKLQSRARQNVILELGYFVGKLGRQGVCPLYKSGVEIPSDYQGVIYTEIDDTGAWKTKLAQELVQAGFSIDLTALLQG